MVNYKRVVCEVAVLFVVLSATTAAPTPDCTHTHYDQSQNGTENIRVNIDGVVIAVAPAEALLEAASDLTDYFDQSSLEFLLKPEKPEDSLKPDSSLKPENSSKPDDILKPTPEKPLSDVSPDADVTPQKKDSSNRKPEKAQRMKNRLVNMLLPLLRRTRHH